MKWLIDWWWIMKYDRIKGITWKIPTKFNCIKYLLPINTQILRYFHHLWRTATKTQKVIQASNTTGRLRKTSTFAGIQRDRSRPLCHSANTNGKITSTFLVFATDLHQLFTDSNINWRNLIFHHSSWVSERTLHLRQVTLEISNDYHHFYHTHTQNNTQDTGLDSSFSITKSYRPTYLSWFKEWSMANILGLEWRQSRPSLLRSMHLNEWSLGEWEIPQSRWALSWHVFCAIHVNEEWWQSLYCKILAVLSHVKQNTSRLTKCLCGGRGVLHKPCYDTSELRTFDPLVRLQSVMAQINQYEVWIDSLW